ncbi:ABC transporter ATP-binding protein [Rhodococcus coprophilus]|uniref:ABC transporter ATP-binding protein n=1 Tax=Rhodococcus coprophilus TaxID=38310 RepID=A0A2X4USU4_9NOCA|nr:ABC transporter ATP-binding protein [Rhodococcus coprophilus]MBM7460205.1 ABC-2 type transport system ATP-binding protein [Rhodococcus coprophilus]SQI38768.1 ABC transporter ATP-binding protein [Rhodococcus coprophilus]
MSVVSCRDVTRSFGDLAAVDGVSLSVEQNEVVGIIGPNGAGKTTLLNCLEGLDVPTSGSIDVLGFCPVKDAHVLAQRVGVQLQHAALLPRLKVGEALELFSSFYARPMPWRPLLETLGIAAKEKSYVAKLSGGERQRVFIALALIHDPELLFLDELTTSLDPQARLAMWEVVRDIRRRGKTVVLTTHYMEEAEALCDRVAIINQGRLVALDTVRGLISAHGGDSTLRLTLDRPTPPTLTSVEGVSSVNSDNAVTIIRGRGAFAQNVLSHLTQAGAVVTDMTMSSPGMEEVFLNLTGRTMREAP